MNTVSSVGSNRQTESVTNAGSTQGPAVGLVFEYFTGDEVAAVRADLEIRSGNAALPQIVAAATNALRAEDVSRTRLVFTGDFVQSVNARDDSGDHAYSTARGAGFVVGKTMPPNADGVVDVLFPSFFALPHIEGEGDEQVRADLVRHLATHEAVHATIHHLKTEPFKVYKRERLGDAALQFAAMASEQVEEHLAEYLANQVVVSQMGETAEDVKASFEALQETLDTKLPGILADDPDYFRKGMFASFEALQIVWKSFSYLAAALRNGDTFAAVPADIASLDKWRDHVAPWWEAYTAMLGRIPMSTDVDIPATDRVVRLIGMLLQRWALGLGFDYHDTAEGAWFQVHQD